MNLSQVHTNIVAVLEATMFVVAALFPIVNPIGGAAVFLAVVDTFDVGLQKVLSKKIAIYSFFLLFVSMLCGGKILSFFGISLYSVQIGGGLIVVITGWQLLTSDGKQPDSSIRNPEEIFARAFYPLTLPITVGPGSISVAVALGAHLPSQFGATYFISPRILAASILGNLLICLTIYICYRWARSAERLLGQAGTTVLMRLSSFIVFCIGVQIVTSGIRSYLITLR